MDIKKPLTSKEETLTQRYITTEDFLKFKAKMCRKKLYQLIKAGVIPTTKIGRIRYIDQYDFDAQMLNKRSA